MKNLCMCLVILFIWVSCGGGVMEEVVEAPVWYGDINMSDGDIYVDAIADMDDILEISGGTGGVEFIDITTYVIDFPAPEWTTLTFTGPDGRSATIDFGGDEIIYTGDLPVAESTRLFFEAFRNLCPECPE